jgi:hypothetical protein
MSRSIRWILVAVVVSAAGSWVMLRDGARANAPQAAPPRDSEQSFRIILGATDTTATVWDGSLSVSAGTPVRLESWRFDDGDRIDGATAWKLSTHPARIFNPQPASERPIVANGVVATFSGLTPASEVRVQTAQGQFTFRPEVVPYGTTARFLGGRVHVDRVPVARPVVSSPAEQDFPAAAVDREGTVWLAYQEFTPNPKFRGIRWALQAEPKSFAELAEPSGGDQILLVHSTAAGWSAPIAVSDPRGDCYRPAVAIDGRGAVWVVWSAKVSGNFDVYARPFEQGKAGRTVRLTTDRGPDIDAVAATDASGLVWVAWQGWRGGRGQIRAARQRGNGFAPEILIASSAGNEWNPAIAASTAGEVAIAWDSYRSGSYDVYFRTIAARDPTPPPGPERAAAASARYEAYPTAAYDGAGRLWLAWEESDEGWGKDFGAYETTGIGLYQGRWVRTLVVEGDRFLAPPDPGAALPGVPVRAVVPPTKQADSFRALQPDSKLAGAREPSRTPLPPARPMNSYPRLAADRGGRIWLAFRTPHPVWFNMIGTVWFEYVTSLDSAGWSQPVFVPHSDNVLDNRPALVSTAANEILLVGSSDGRQQSHASLRNLDFNNHRDSVDDPYQNDLYASRVALPAAQAPSLQQGSAPQIAAAAGPESAASRRLRDYRARLGGTEYRIYRGEFHRHTEVSMDAGRDGSLREAWRYAIDAATMDWIGCCDHDNGFGREYTWWLTQKLTDVFNFPGSFTSMFSYERSVQYPEGHRNVIFATRGIRTLPRLPRTVEAASGKAPDTQMFYRYLRHFNGIVASHTSGTNMGTDWRDNDAVAEPVVEIYQGDRQNYEMPDAPRSNNAKDSIGGWREKGFVSLALEKGYRLAFQSSSDHISTHMSYCNLYATGSTREALLEAFQKRHVYGATDDILADVRSGSHMMGDEFETRETPSLTVKLAGTAPFAKVHVIKDSRYVYTTEPKSATVDFTWRDTAPAAGKTSYYYVRGEQSDGEIVWASPMWITYRPAGAGTRSR